MTNDPSIREQSYRYFLQEAPELLGVLEQELLSLREDFSINKVNTLMRTTHTLKGAAASVGLETIQSVAHSLEDIFKALFNPNLSLDPEVEALIFEGYECLRLPLTAELTGGQVNDAEVLDRTAAVFAQLQEKLGDCFGQEAHLPTSVELGFDLTQSIFEVGVNQRLDEIAVALTRANPEEVATILRTQAEVFIGLAESLNLPGFGAIAKTAIAALDALPEQAPKVAQTALADFQAGQEAVLNGDRSQGGQPSLALQQLAGVATRATERVVNITDPGVELEATIVNSLETVPTAESILDFGLPTGKSDADGQILDSGQADKHSEILEADLPGTALSREEIQNPQSAESQVVQVNAHKSATGPTLGGVTSAADSELNSRESHNEESGNSLLESIWGGSTLLDSEMSAQGGPAPAGSISAVTPNRDTLQATDSAALSSSLPASPADSASWLPDEPEDAVKISPSRPLRTDSAPTSIPQKDQASVSHTVRVNVEHLEQLNSSTGELLTNHNRQSLQNEQLRSSVRALLVRLQRHQQLLDQLQDWSDRQFHVTEQRRTVTGDDWQSDLPFDSLELDRYSEAQILVQSILEDAVQLAEATEAIDLFVTQSNQTLEKQRRLLTSTRDALMEARMLPLGEIFGRFHRVLQQLEIRHNKQVTLELGGTEVLVDKVVAQKLYDPLLHLVRNAFDHGIESFTVRQQRGKPKLAKIEISASYQGRYLVIEVRDDGQGLDFEQIRQRAVEFQLVDAQRARHLNKAQLTDLLFEPGFSTASGVNELSGRGIGLDVVRTQLDALHGVVTVDSEPQQGTTFVLQIPLSLTIAKLLLCQAGNRIYALFADAIDQILIPQEDQIRSWEGGKVIRWGKGDLERLIPVHQLSTVLDYFSQVPESSVYQPNPAVVSQEQVMPIILIRSQDTLLGLEVDQLIGEQELVIRPLGAMVLPPSYIYGASVLADGRLTLVLDGAALMQYLFDQQSDGSRGSLPYFSLLGTRRALPQGARDSYAADAPYYTNASRDLTSSTSHRLPFSHEQRLLPAQSRGSASEPTAPDFRGRLEKRVLLVDDSITLRQTLALTLQRAGYQVLQAKDGYEAIEQFRQHKNIELVICDIEMPRMNGFEFLKHRQQDPDLAKIPVVILTSRNGSKHRLIASELGATAYITKPFLEDKLLEAVTDVIEKSILNSAINVIG